MARRLFAGVAVAVPDALREWLAGLQRELHADRIRWVRPENLHLTVEFFGETSEERIPALMDALTAAAAAVPAFMLSFGELGVFGGARHPRVIWLGVESGGLFALHDQVANALRVCGWQPDPRTFSPHLTLGRITRLRDLPTFRNVLVRHGRDPAREQAVHELLPYEIMAGRYLPIRRWALVGA